MKDAYMHDHEGVLNFVSNLREKSSNYNDKIVELTNLIEEINQSPAWRDVDVKTSFVNTCNSYIMIYKNLIQALDVYANYLSKKSNAGADFESKYAGG